MVLTSHVLAPLLPFFHKPTRAIPFPPPPLKVTEPYLQEIDTVATKNHSEVLRFRVASMSSMHRLLVRAKAHLKRTKHRSTITIIWTKPPQSVDNIAQEKTESIIITEVELSSTIPRTSLELPASISKRPKTIIQLRPSTPRSCLKTATSAPQPTGKKTLSWRDRYERIGPAANERELLTIFEIERGEDEKGYTKQDVGIWKLNRLIHGQVDKEERKALGNGGCKSAKTKFLREEEFRRYVLVVEDSMEGGRGEEEAR